MLGYGCLQLAFITLKVHSNLNHTSNVQEVHYHTRILTLLRLKQDNNQQ